MTDVELHFGGNIYIFVKNLNLKCSLVINNTICVTVI